MRYTPRRQSKRWLHADCPPGVLAIYDNKDCGDRYTIFYRDPVAGTRFADMWLSYRAADSTPFHPQGIGLYCEMEAYQVSAFRYRNRHHAAKWSDLPADVQKLVRQDLAE